MERLLTLRKAMGLTQKEVAEKLGISRQAYANYEIGNREPDHKTLIEIAKLFNVSLDYLLGKEEKPVAESDELTEYLEELKSRPEMRMLFSLAKGATKEDVERAVAIIEALRKNDNG